MKTSTKNSRPRPVPGPRKPSASGPAAVSNPASAAIPAAVPAAAPAAPKKPSRFPLFLYALVELVLVMVAGVLVLASALTQACVRGIQRLAIDYAAKHKLAPVFPGARAQVAELLLADEALARKGEKAGVRR